MNGWSGSFVSEMPAALTMWATSSNGSCSMRALETAASMSSSRSDSSCFADGDEAHSTASVSSTWYTSNGRVSVSVTNGTAQPGISLSGLGARWYAWTAASAAASAAASSCDWWRCACRRSAIALERCSSSMRRRRQARSRAPSAMHSQPTSTKKASSLASSSSLRLTSRLDGARERMLVRSQRALIRSTSSPSWSSAAKTTSFGFLSVSTAAPTVRGRRS
mmetsp:Transcript_6578/g.15924  ORF Transcript_6578/g.15924 Transcript_6578/m.15924 type:complete len:221 (-) Transcript_6578:2027-2689(-)